MRKIKFRYVYRNVDTDRIILIEKDIIQIEKDKEPYLDEYVLISRDGFTGLTDMNGKEIYEGDILSYDYADNTETKDWMKRPYYIATFNEDKLITHGVYLLYPKKNMFLPPFRFRHTEVMGNIHDNPELLNKQNK